MKRAGLVLVAGLAAMLLLGLPPATLFSQTVPDTMSVSGTLVNGTAGGPSPAGTTMLLHVFGSDTASVDTHEALTNSEGMFQFDDVSVPSEGGSVALVADYGGARYRKVVPPAELTNPLSLIVYDATQDAKVVATTEQSIIVAGVDASTRRIAAVQLFSLENRSDTTLVPDLSAMPVLGQFSFLRFSLPPDASDLDVATDLVGGEVIPVGTGFAITAPVPPGEHQVSFTFTVPYEGDTLAWRDNTLQGADAFRLLIPAEFGGIGVGGLPSGETIAVSDVSYRVWQANNIAPGGGVNLALTGLPEPNRFLLIGNSLTGLRFWYAAIPALLVVLLAGLLVWGVWHRSGASTPPGQVGA